MEMRLEKNNCNLFRKTRNFYSVTLGLGLSVKFQIWGGGYSEALRLGLSVKFQMGGILKLSDLDSLSNFKFGGVF